MAAYLINRKVLALSVLTVSSATVLYWSFWRRKKQDSQVSGTFVRDKPRTTKNIAHTHSHSHGHGDGKLTTSTYSTNEREIKVLVDRLESGSNRSCEETRAILQTLLKTTGFTEQQAFFLECGGLTAAAKKLTTTRDEGIQEVILQIMNNMALNKEGQRIIKIYMPELLDIVSNGSSNLVLKSLQVLTNLAVLDDYHQDLVAQMSHSQWSELLQSNVLEIQIQTLKLLVNLSTNQDTIDNLATTELLHSVCNFISPNVQQDLCLRSVTFVANILSTVERLQHIALKNFVTSIPGLQENASELTKSDVEDIRYQANRICSLLMV